MKKRRQIAAAMALGMMLTAVPFTTGSAEETKVLTIALPQNANVENYDTNYLTQLLEKECNVDIQFMLLPTSLEDAKSKLALMASSGEKLPDVVCMQLTNLEVAEYGSKGVFQALNDYIGDAPRLPTSMPLMRKPETQSYRPSQARTETSIHWLIIHRKITT